MKTKLILTLGALCLAALPIRAEDAPAEAEVATSDTVRLELELPKPMFVGTPTNIVSDNLEEPRTGSRELPLVPIGTENVASYMEVTASDMEPIIGDLEYVTDGDKDGEEGYYVELGPGLQWVQIDLEQPWALHAIVIWHYHTQARVYRDVVVRVSNDPDFLTGVTTVFNNDHDNSAGFGLGEDKEFIETYEGKVIELDGIEAQYVRVYSDGNTSNPMNHYTEIEVFGSEPAE